MNLTKRERWRRRIGEGCGAVAVAVGALVLIGWTADIDVLKRMLPGLATMKANAAVAFALSGASLLLGGGARWPKVGFTAAILVVLIGLLTLAQFPLAVDLGIDQLLFRDSTMALQIHPGRMASATGVIFVFVGAALALVHARRSALSIQALCVTALFLSMVCCLGYLYGAEDLHTFGPFGSVAIHTAITAFVLNIGILATTPNAGVIRLLTGESLGGALMRRMLPAAFFTPVFIGWIRLLGQREGLYGTEFGLALFAVSNIVIFAILVLWSAVETNRSETRLRQVEAGLRASERRYRALIQATPQIVWSIGSSDTTAANWWWDLTGQTPRESEGLGWLDAVHSEDRDRVRETWQRAYAENVFYDTEYRVRNRSGEFRYYSVRGVALCDSAGVLEEWIGTLTDIHDRKMAEMQLRDANATLERRVGERTAALQSSEERFRLAVDATGMGVWDTALPHRTLGWDDKLKAMWGFSEQSEVELASLFGRIHPDDRDRVERVTAESLDPSGTGSLSVEHRIRRPDGEERWVAAWGHTLFAPEHGRSVRTIGVMLDVTERRRAEERTKASLREKETLLKEIHHRVKNNLQIVSSLLDLQSGYTADPEALRMFEESRGRVRSMALIHQRLYRSRDLTRVDFGEYIRQLADDLYMSYRISADRLELAIAADDMKLPLDLAIPCGLILNELISNCLKHAFGEGAGGRLRVSLYRVFGDTANIVLEVSDDGKGLPPGFDYRNSPSFGMQLVHTLVEQLNGDLRLVDGVGTTVAVRFREHIEE